MPSIVVAVTESGSLRLLQGLFDLLAENGWEVHVISSEGSALEALSKHPGITIHAIPMQREVAPTRDLRSQRDWVKTLKRIQPDVVFTGTPKAGLLGILAARVTGVPTRIYHVRGLRLDTATGNQRRILYAMEKLALAASTSALVVSKSLRTQLLALRLAKETKLAVLDHGSSNGVDTVRFSPGQDSRSVQELGLSLGLDPSIPVIGYVGRITQDKGLEHLAEASARLTAETIGHQILVVGSIDGQHDSALTALQNLEAEVVFAGPVDDPAPYYQLMHVFCLPTLREGFPNVVLEASASGIPVVTTNATGAIDSVEDGATGFIAQARSGQSLASALAKVIGNSELATEMGQKGRRMTEDFYSRPHVQELVCAYIASEYEKSSR